MIKLIVLAIINASIGAHGDDDDWTWIAVSWNTYTCEIIVLIGIWMEIGNCLGMCVWLLLPARADIHWYAPPLLIIRWSERRGGAMSIWIANLINDNWIVHCFKHQLSSRRKGVGGEGERVGGIEWGMGCEGARIPQYVHAHRKSPSLPLSFVCAKKERLEGARNAIPGYE